MENSENDGTVSQEKILDEYFMKIANLTSTLSKDPRCKVGACIVNEDKQIVGVGYNSMPKGREDSDENWDKDKKMHFVCHAEMNAIANKTSFDVRNCSIYVTLFPCDECAVLIIQAGIKEVIYKYGEINPKYNNVKSKTILDSTIKLRQLNPGTTFSTAT